MTIFLPLVIDDPISKGVKSKLVNIKYEIFSVSKALTDKKQKFGN